jgi:hypothetical protein
MNNEEDSYGSSLAYLHEFWSLRCDYYDRPDR